MKNVLYISVLICLTSCGFGATSHDYITRASYKATKSKLQLDLLAEVNVPVGHDLGEGLVSGKISGGLIEDTIVFQNNSVQLLALQYKGQQKEIADSTDIGGAFISLLTNHARVNFDSQEIIELGEVVRVAAYGPKATYMKGQTELVEVLYVSFE